jgi:hypothetical protein
MVWFKINHCSKISKRLQSSYIQYMLKKKDIKKGVISPLFIRLKVYHYCAGTSSSIIIVVSIAAAAIES